VQWLRNVPQHWEVRKLQYCATINDEALPETTEPDYEICYVDIGSVDPVFGINLTEEMIFENAPSRARRIVRDGDTIVSTVRTYLRSIAAIKKPPVNLIVSTGFAVIRPRVVEPVFLSYTLREAGFIDTIVARSVGVSYPAINASEIGTIPIPVPSPDEQPAIADFLDRETAKIDALIEKKQALIEKLKEKRSALISRTVTRGLPPDAARAARLDPHPPTKHSGLDWLGDIPARWNVKSLKRACTLIKDGTHLPPARQSDGIPLLSVRNVVGDTFMFLADDSMISEDDYRELCRSFVVKENDILLAIVGATLGKVAIVPRMEPFHIQRSLAVFRCREKEAAPRFLAAWFRSSGFQNLLWVSVAFSAQPGIYLGTLREFPFLAPPLFEQVAIADYLDQEMAKLDSLTDKVEAAIERLQERRTALITAAVTGKIDVRGVVA
jgi:type I restriction enzyme, S subunit